MRDCWEEREFQCDTTSTKCGIRKIRLWECVGEGEG